MNPMDLIMQAIENILFAVGFALLFGAAVQIGKYLTYQRPVYLSKLFPELDSVEPETKEEREHNGLMQLLAQSLVEDSRPASDRT